MRTPDLDFIHFVWEHSERFNFKKYAMTHIFSDDTHRLLLLRHYRA